MAKTLELKDICTRRRQQEQTIVENQNKISYTNAVINIIFTFVYEQIFFFFSIYIIIIILKIIKQNICKIALL